MKISNFGGLNHQTKTKKTFNVGGFKGVDFTSPTFDVDQSHAIDMVNFYRKDNVLEKRSGYNHIATLNGLNIHNIWLFNGKFIINASGSLYVYNKELSSCEKSYTGIVKDQYLNAFYKNKKLWILGGIKFLVVESDFSLKNVEDIAEIPTTTIGIVPNNLGNIGDTNRASYDAFNNLTHFHKNELTSGIPGDGSKINLSEILTYDLDMPLNLKSDLDIDKTTIEITFNSENLSAASEGLNEIKLLPVKATPLLDDEVVYRDQELDNTFAGSDSFWFKDTENGKFLWIVLGKSIARIDPRFLILSMSQIAVNNNLDKDNTPYTDFSILDLMEEGKVKLTERDGTGQHTLKLTLDSITFDRNQGFYTYKERLYKVKYGALVSNIFREYVYRKTNPGSAFAPVLNTFKYKAGTTQTGGFIPITVTWEQFNLLQKPSLSIEKCKINYLSDDKNSRGILFEWSQDYEIIERTAVSVGQTFTLNYQAPTNHECFIVDGLLYDVVPKQGSSDTENNVFVFVRRVK